VLLNINWLSTPTDAEIQHAFPPKALAEKSGGTAGMTCRVEADGALDDCQLKSEYPKQLGFGDAALSLSSRYRLDAKDYKLVRRFGGRLDVTVIFPRPN
jgi:hypothetical protein